MYALDTYGQGENVKEDLSNASIWPVDGFIKMVTAHNEMVKEAKKNDLPTYIFSHSMGSYMGQDYIQRFSGKVDKVVLCGAGAKNGAVGPGLVVAKMITNKKNRNQKMIKTLFFDVGYTLVTEDAVWERRCKDQAETEEAKKLGVSAEDIYHEIEKASIEGLPQFRTVIERFNFSTMIY